jgi:hypothetical protein
MTQKEVLEHRYLNEDTTIPQTITQQTDIDEPHYLNEVTTAPQTFCHPTPEPPSPTTLDQHFVIPLHHDLENLTLDIDMTNDQPTRVFAPIERLPVEIFGKQSPHSVMSSPSLTLLQTRLSLVSPSILPSMATLHETKTWHHAC